MAKVSPTPPLLGPLHHLYVSPPDDVLSQVIIFFLPYAGTSSRIDAHVFSACGLASYPRMTIDPSSNFYAAVDYMPLARRESEAHRALAYVLCKYFTEVSSRVKAHCLATQSNTNTTAIPFDAYHAGEIAAKLVKIESETAIPNVVASMRERYLNCIEIDLVLGSSPPVGLTSANKRLLEIFGETTTLPSGKLKRTQSKSNRSRAKSVVLQTPNPENVDQQIQELLNTEISYVDKLESFFVDFIHPERARSTNNLNKEPTVQTLKELFPQCLDEILRLNEAFLHDLQKAYQAGPESVAQVCLAHFPGFRRPYTEYIQLNPAFSGLLPKLLKGKTTFSKRIESTGEQRLRSLLIEPVQRLPRYSLLIDVMINNLPPDSSATPNFIACRNIITEICEMEATPVTEGLQTASRLSSLITSWPSTLKPDGRVNFAVDFLDIMHPFADSCEQISSIMLLFADIMVFVRRLKPGSLKAQGIMAELDRPQAMSGAINRHPIGDLQFSGWINLADIRLSESDKGRAVWLVLEKELRDFNDTRMGNIGTRKFWLCNAWEGKATELVEAIILARIAVKVSKTTELRYISRLTGMHGIDIWTAVFKLEDFPKDSSKSKVVLCTKDCGTQLDSDKSIEILGIITNIEPTKDTGKFRIELKSGGKTLTVDTVNENDFLAVLVRRLSTILEIQNQPAHRPLTIALVESNKRILQSLILLPPPENESRFKSFRPPSPVKLISNILGGNSPLPPKPLPRDKLIFENAPILPAPKVLERAHSVVYKSEAAEEDVESRLQRITIVEGWGGEEDTYHRRLERSLEAFIIGLQVALEDPKTDLSQMQHIDAANVPKATELVNALLKDHKNPAPAMRAPAAVLYLGFEIFIRNAWQESMGSLLSRNVLQDMLKQFGSLYPNDFENYFKHLLSEMTPQNKRAFKTVVTLISRVIKSSLPHNRDVLLRLFAELLVKSGYPKGNVQVEDEIVEFVPLLDYIVDESDNLFGDSMPSPARDGFATPDYNSSIRRSKTLATSTIGSTSSLKKRFGLHSGTDETNARPTAASVWRTLSKKGEKDRPDSPPKSPFLARSRSTDQDNRAKAQQRPMSRDRPIFDGPPGTPRTNAASINMSPIRGSPAPGTPGSPVNTPSHPRRKRRSSLSDLKTLNSSPRPLFQSPRLSPDRSVPSNLPKLPETSRIPARKENRPVATSALPVAIGRESSYQKQPSKLERNRSARDPLASQKADAIAPLNIVKVDNKDIRNKPVSSTKLQEKLNHEKRELSAAKTLLDNDMSKLGEELAQIKIGPRSSKAAVYGNSSSNLQNNSEDLRQLTSRLSKLEKQSTITITELNQKYESLHTMFLAFMSKKEKEVQGLDKLYKDVNDENDVLFERFNDELAKVATSIRSNEGEKELIRTLQKTTEQEGNLRAENARLKRENLNLKHLLQ